MFDDIGDTLCDLKRFVEDVGGVLVMILLFVGVGLYFIFLLAPEVAIGFLLIIGAFFVIILSLRIASYLLGYR